MMMMKNYGDSWRQYWDVGLIPIPSDPVARKPILPDTVKNWEQYNNESTVMEWAKLYPEYDVALMLTNDFIVVSTSSQIITDFIHSLRFETHPVCYFENGRSRHFFLNPDNDIIKSPMHLMRGHVSLKVSNKIINTEQINVLGRGRVFHVPPTFNHKSQSRFYWNPAPWELRKIPRVDIHRIKEPGYKHPDIKIVFQPD